MGTKAKVPAGRTEMADVISNQEATMKLLLLFAVISVPLMLCVVPCWENMKIKKARKVDDDDSFSLDADTEKTDG